MKKSQKLEFERPPTMPRKWTKEDERWTNLTMRVMLYGLAIGWLSWICYKARYG